ncbi:YunG family protein [Kitasatospora sp. NBC_00458]|uniref:YunG family protein n=1 Tax=Kitasatospora sp. NBC_00458 TaxID=2903568 RepID=UPI002E178EBF
MTAWTLNDIERAIRSSWGVDTCAPEDLAHWRPDNPARGQCGATALVVHDLLGGELMMGEVYVGGVRTDLHWWNRSAAGVEVDLTRSRFGPDERVGPGRPVARPQRPGRLQAQYQLLRGRVVAHLEAGRAVTATRLPERACA